MYSLWHFCYISDMMDEQIDWTKLRARIASTPMPTSVKHIKKVEDVEDVDAVERRRAAARERSKKHYWANREHCIEVKKTWEAANPEKVKAKKKRYYDTHKNDPVWMEQHRQKNREYKARKKAEKEALKNESGTVLRTEA